MNVKDLKQQESPRRHPDGLGLIPALGEDRAPPRGMLQGPGSGSALLLILRMLSKSPHSLVLGAPVGLLCHLPFTPFMHADKLLPDGCDVGMTLACRSPGVFAINGTKRLAPAAVSSPLSTAGGRKYLLASSFPLFSAERRNSRSLLNAPPAPSLGGWGAPTSPRLPACLRRQRSPSWDGWDAPHGKGSESSRFWLCDVSQK